MKENKKAFYLFYDWIDDLDELDGADAWKVIKAICEYYRHGTNPLDNVDGTLKVVVSIMFHQIKRSEKISQIRSRAARSKYDNSVNFAEQKSAKQEQRSATIYSIQNTNNTLSTRVSKTRPPAHTCEDKKAYGKYDNVYLTDKERSELTELFGSRADELIENFSAKLKSKGYTYDDHYVTIRLWETQDSEARGIVKNNVADGTAQTEQEQYAEEWYTALLKKNLAEAEGEFLNDQETR